MLSTGDLIEDNLIGVLADSSLIGNGSTGIFATNTNGLVIVGNTVEASGLYSNIENALIATSGIEIDTSVGTTIGGTTSGAGNFIADNASNGIALLGVQGPAVIGNTIQQTAATASMVPFSGSPALISDNIVESNQREGIYLSQSSVTLTIQGNDIENNGGGASHGGTGVSIRGLASEVPSRLTSMTTRSITMAARGSTSRVGP